MNPLPKPYPASSALREFFERRIGMIERQMKLPRTEAEREALRITTYLARNRRYSWADLREAVSGYPLLSPLLPATAGAVDTLPGSLPRYAVLATGSVVRQGAFVEKHVQRRRTLA